MRGLPCVLLLCCIAAGAGATEAGHGHREVLDRCLSSTQRTQELQKAGRARVERSVAGAHVAVPEQLQGVFARLKKAARLPGGAEVSLVAADMPRGAAALDSGHVLVSSRLWREDPALDADELAAVLAHELAHVELRHVKLALCETVALSGNEGVPLAGAAQAVRQAVASGRQDLVIAMMQRSHLREFAADQRAAELLDAIGVPRAAFGRMLLKVTRGGYGDYSGSHPAVEVRLQQLGMEPEHVAQVPARP